MILPLLVDDARWCGPVAVTFLVQFPGDPFDPKRNDVKVVFLGEKNQKEERSAFFDPTLGAWRSTLFTKQAGRYRPKLVRNGKEALTECEEGILEVRPDEATGLLTGSRPDRLTLDTGDAWFGIGADLGSKPTPSRIDALADSGATWVRVVSPSQPLDDDTLDAFGEAMDALARRNLRYTLSVPADASEAWRRYVLARFGNSPRLLEWESPIDDPWKRPTASTATPWPGLFENKPGPFVTKEGDAPRVRALGLVVEKSGWLDWKAAQTYRVDSAKGVAEGNRMALVVEPGAKLTNLPVVDGDYDLTTIDPTTGGATTESARVARSSLTLSVSAERFLVLQRKA